ncbi:MULTISPECIES: hydroxymethylglutaryl-CoA lyase [Mycobacterium]|uniref:hydroxymethylglutaryl-CoA lyase n=1 Tax=Mycobacterium TaxID=1763 RepID=UPI0002D338A8|nr:MULTISPECIES: hydroxymethylglutaryl-CoA lyase [Mycobacterium]QWY63631.1 hydroxymethylglutaryl-CoA lyase [Mycobacterium avium subsp. hominissuis]WSE51437.1 hydroxymethylglutaryl-CoA lyase [Mycobacterium sp. 2-64]BCO49674.1 putative pyruvate carboxyltransferase [Mycobacterium paraintracellulare]BCO86863.1 putative pyruvate carboxyltransferase [Mycobacterium paraintracellulare]
MPADDTVVVTEVSLRDGLQIEPVIVPTDKKVAFAHRLVDAGFTQLEVGAFVNAAKVPAMADSAEVVHQLGDLPVTLHALVFNLKGAQRAIASGCRNVRFVVSASDGHSHANAGVSTSDALDRVDEAAELLRDNDVHLEATIATAFVCPFDGDTPVQRVLRVAERLTHTGIDVLHLADTIGAASPGDIRRTISAVSAEYTDVPLGLHLHNTYGMAAANVWEGLQLGIRRFDAALGGLGGCPFAPGAAGNIGADDLVHFLHREGFVTGVQPDRLADARQELTQLVGHQLDSSLARANKPPAMLRLA